MTLISDLGKMLSDSKKRILEERLSSIFYKSIDTNLSAPEKRKATLRYYDLELTYFQKYQVHHVPQPRADRR